MIDQIRIVHDNAADRATIVADDTADGMGTACLKTDIKGEVCRILASSAQLVLTWSVLETVKAVVLPATNLGPSSTIRVRAYLDVEGEELLADTGERWAAPGALMAHWTFAQPLNVNAFSEHSVLVATYLDEHVACRRIEIDLDDPDAEFLDLARLVVGPCLGLRYGASVGMRKGVTDLTRTSRSAAGDLRSDWGPKAGTLTFDLAAIEEEARLQVEQLLWGSVGQPLFVSLLPLDADPVRERQWSCYGRLAQPAALAMSSRVFYSTQIQMESF